MHTFENLYNKKDNVAFVSAHLRQYLVAEIYSPAVIRLAYDRWNEMPYYARASVHTEISDLLTQSPMLNDAQIQQKINAHLVTRAIKILVAYSHCPVPITRDKTIPIFHKNFLSDRGKLALKSLLKTATQSKFTHDMAELSLRTSHKFLMDLGYYRNLINSGSADVLTTFISSKKGDFKNYIPPIVQLVQGCPNHCSHCFASAESHLSYMPYPMWRKIYQTLNNRYQYYHDRRIDYKVPKWISWIPGVPKTLTWNYSPFDRFFHDSDPSIYHDPIINADVGDIALLLKDNEAPFYFLTKGMTGVVSRRAIAKVASAYPIDISFVDTPKENKKRSIDQYKKTVNLILSVHNNQGIARIWHLQLKNGPTTYFPVPKGTEVIKTLIQPCGRANQFAPEELDMDHPNAMYPFTINPNGDVVLPRCENTLYIQEKINNILGNRERE